MNRPPVSLFSDRKCEHCGRPSIGEHPCPHDPDRKECQQRMRHLGR